MDRAVQQWQIPEGTDVVGADGDKVGKVVAAEASYIVVEKGFFFPTDYYIPTSAVANFDGDKVYLTVTKDEALNQDWGQMPVDAAAYDTAATGYAEATAGASALEGDRLAGVTPTGIADEVREGETLRVPVHEEELSATTHPVERGRIRIDKDVIAEERTLDVPVTEERVVVHRRTVDRDAPADEAVLAEDTIEIPIRGEAVDVRKRNRVVEEVEIGKERVQRTERVTGTVRREDVRVDESSADTTGANS
jgi:uncharacterized protein (TIGR02271 family)